MISEETRKLAHDVAIGVAKGDGFAVSNVKSVFEKDSKAYEKFKEILSRKWHIKAVPIEGDFVLFIIDSYGESHEKRIMEKAKNIVNEHNAIMATIEGFFPETLRKLFFN